MRELPLARCPLPIYVIETKEEIRRLIPKLKREAVLGIDTETRPSFEPRVRYEVSLLQIATSEACYLIRLNKTGLTRSLIHLLENPRVLKIGLALSGDVTALRRLRKFEPQSFVELQKLCSGYGIKELGLQKIYAILFGEQISKSERMSNWEAETLGPRQQHYAALDAWAVRRIYLTLLEQPDPSPSLFALL